MIAKYWIAKYTENLFRDEPRNVGVVVQLADQFAAKFLGEVMPGHIDGRLIRSIDCPDVYRQWVDHWRRRMLKGFRDYDFGDANFTLKLSGEVMDTYGDSPDEVVAQLYARLVDTTSRPEAIILDNEATKDPDLESSVHKLFREYQLLRNEEHYIQTDVLVRGVIETHVPDYYQKNGSTYVFQLIDFTKRYKNPVVHIAGHSAMMFQDIKDYNSKVISVAITQFTEDDYKRPEVRYGLKLAESKSDIVLNWGNEDDRDIFLKERVEAAQYG